MYRKDHDMKEDKKLLSEGTAARLTEMITEKKQFKVGDRLPSESELAGMLGVSRNTLREAVKMLVAQGLLVIKRGNGTFVEDIAPITGSDVQGPDWKKVKLKELLELRLMLEPMIAAKAAERATEREISAIRECGWVIEDKMAAGQDRISEELRFHELITEAAHNSLFSQLMPTIFEAIQASTEKAGKTGKLVRDTMADHALLIDALETHDPSCAELAMRMHVVKAIAVLGYDAADFK